MFPTSNGSIQYWHNRNSWSQTKLTKTQLLWQTLCCSQFHILMTTISPSGCKEGSCFKSPGTRHQQTEPTCSYTASTFVHLHVAYQQEKVLPKCLSLPSPFLLPTKHLLSAVWCSTQQEAPKTENWPLPVQISLFLKIIISPKIDKSSYSSLEGKELQERFPGSYTAPKSKVKARNQHLPVGMAQEISADLVFVLSSC